MHVYPTQREDLEEFLLEYFPVGCHNQNIRLESPDLPPEILIELRRGVYRQAELHGPFLDRSRRRPLLPS